MIPSVFLTSVLSFQFYFRNSKPYSVQAMLKDIDSYTNSECLSSSLVASYILYFSTKYLRNNVCSNIRNVGHSLRIEFNKINLNLFLNGHVASNRVVVLSLKNHNNIDQTRGILFYMTLFRCVLFTLQTGDTPLVCKFLILPILFPIFKGYISSGHIQY